MSTPSRRMIEKMSLKELRALRLDIEEQMEVKRAKEKEKLRDDVHKMLADKGLSIDEVFTTSKTGLTKRRRRPTKPSKVYANPNNPSQTWNGWGRTPKWFVDAGMTK